MLHDLCPPDDRCVTLPLNLEGEGGRDTEGGREGGMAGFVSVNQDVLSAVEQAIATVMPRMHKSTHPQTDEQHHTLRPS